MVGPDADLVRVGVAELRFRRLLAFILGLSVLGYLVVDLPALQAQADYYPTWWTIPVFVGQAVAGVMLTVFVWFADARTLRIILIVFAAFGLVAIATLIPAAGIGGLPDALGAPWVLRVKTNFALAAALALTPMATWVFIAADLALAGVARWLLSSVGDPLVALEDTVVSLSVMAILVLWASVVLASARALDLAAARAAEAVRRDAAEAAVAVERRRVELLAHDDILYALRAAAQGIRSKTVTPQSLARETLHRLDLLDGPETGEREAPIPLVEFLRRLRALATDFAPDAEFLTMGDAELTLPSDTASALLEASGEALRNSVAHAGDSRRPVRRRVAVSSSEPGVTIAISDDGRGFRPRRVPAHRLGISRSILERTRSLPGGFATVTSTLGAGTTIHLGWRP